MKQSITLFTSLLLLTAGSAWAQVPAQTPARTPTAVDSTRQIRSATDTIPQSVQRNGIRVGSSELLPDDSTSLAGADTLRLNPKQQAEIRRIIPRKATIRSLMVPGLGQIYNRQYWKLPFIYGGAVAAVVVFQFNQRLYNAYSAGYEEAYNQSAVNPLYGVKTATVRGRVLSVAQLKQATDQFRQQRDLTIILTAVGWALNAVEANVAAHLKTFDLSDDISLNVHPNVLPLPGAGLVPGVRVAMTFR